MTTTIGRALSIDQALHEPVAGVFNTQHSKPHNRQIAHRGLILLTEVGSTMHGVSQDTSGDDIDEMGICIESPEVILGIDDFEQYEYRTQPVNHRSGPGDIDRTVYSLKKWTRLAAAGNPTVLMPIFAGEQHLRYNDSIFGVGLRTRAKDLLITKQAGHKFLGYLDGQRQRYLDPSRVDSKHASRPELVEKYGWDTKTGYHALRLALQGTELMNTGVIPLPMAEANREFLLKVRNGEFSKEWVTDLLDNRYIPMLKRAIEYSSLPERADMAAVNVWLSKMYQTFWKHYG